MDIQEKTTIALVQFSPKLNEKKANLEISNYYMSKAKKLGAEIAMFPEMFTTGYTADKEAVQYMAETIDGASIKYLQKAAINNNIAVVGSLLERATNKDCLFNTSIFISSQGDILGAFRKIHLFSSEKEVFTPGKEVVTVDYNGIRYGMLICYDIEFPEVARLLAVKNAQVLLTVSANMKPYGPFHRNYALARAKENHVFTAYCNQVGNNGDMEFVGESCIINPLGEIICELAGEEGIVIGSVKLSDICRSREVFNYLNERRIFFA